jgi:hypothetical protein
MAERAMGRGGDEMTEGAMRWQRGAMSEEVAVWRRWN